VLQVAELLLATGKADVNARNNNSETALVNAAGRGFESIAKLLLKSEKIRVNFSDRRNLSPLRWAYKNNHMSIVKLLPDSGKVKPYHHGGSTG
jgi:ankyrin repeat protein